MPIDVEVIGCDFLSSTGRKFVRGPRGTGFLFASDRAIAEIEPPFIDGHAASWVSRGEYALRNDARRFENWETNLATRIGLGVAARYANSIGLQSIWLRVRSLAVRLRESLSSIRGVTVCDLGQVKCGIVTFICEGRSSEAVNAQLRRQKINCGTIDASWTRIDMDDRGLSAVVRASVHYYNTEHETDALAEAIAQIMAEPALA
jgi:selenocysteine lyase/cysteine desulfurase